MMRRANPGQVHSVFTDAVVSHSRPTESSKKRIKEGTQFDYNGNRLEVGDRVRVVSGRNTGETGTVFHVGEPFGGFKGLSIQCDGPQSILGPLILKPSQVVKESRKAEGKRVRESGYKPSWRETAELIQRDVFDAWQPDMGGPFTFKLYRDGRNTATLDDLSFVEAVALFWDYAKECWDEGMYLTVWGADGEWTEAEFELETGHKTSMSILSAKYESPHYRGESRKRRIKEGTQFDYNGNRLEVGDRVRVVSGRNVGETGTVFHVGEPFGGFKGLSITTDGPQSLLGPLILKPSQVVKESRKRVRESSGWVEPDNPDDTYSLDALAYVQREGFLDYEYEALVAYSYELGALNPHASAGIFLSEMNLYYHEDKEIMIAAFFAGQRGVSESRKRQPRSKRSK
mgnify:FL=1